MTTTHTTNMSLISQVRSGSLQAAYKLFAQAPFRDAVAWNILISAQGQGRHFHPEKALALYKHMVRHKVSETPSTFSTLLGICCRAGFHKHGSQIHSRIVVLGFTNNIFIATSIVNLYMLKGQSEMALSLFHALPERNAAIWNLVIHGFCQKGSWSLLLRLFSRMLWEGVEPEALTFCYLLRGCGSGCLLHEGEQLHSHIIKSGWLDASFFVKNAIVDFYSACGSLNSVKRSLESIRVEDIICWNSIVSVYAENGLVWESLRAFRQMQLMCKRPSSRSFSGFLTICCKTRDLVLGRAIHCCVMKLGFDNWNVYIQSSLVNMYGKCGDIKMSVSIFESSPFRSLECCNSLMTSFFHCGLTKDVIELFGLMVNEEIGFDEVTLSSTLQSLPPAMASSNGLLHCCAVKSGLESDGAVSSSLIDAYSKLGEIGMSVRAFEQIPSPNSICFTSLIRGFALNGMGKSCLEMFETMTRKGLKPEDVTFLCVLMGCAQSGMVCEGKLLFNSMESSYGVHPEQKHFSCMVHLLGRAGLLEEAEELLQRAPSKYDAVGWRSLLRSCRIHRNATVGMRAAHFLLHINPGDPDTYFQVSKFYEETGNLEISMQIMEASLAVTLRRSLIYYHSLSLNLD